MPLLDLFRSKPDWQHKDPNVRATAVRQMGDGDRELLGSLARQDPDARVRRAALKKLTDAVLVAEIAQSDSDPGVREEAGAFLLRVALESGDELAGPAALAAIFDPRHLLTAARTARLESTQRSALERLVDAKALATVARTAEFAGSRLQALSRIEDPALVAEIALKSEHKDVALAALERLDSPDTLEAAAARARNKAVARRARALLDARARAARAEATPVPRQAPPEDAAAEQAERAEAERQSEERSRAIGDRVRLCESVESLDEDGALEQLEQARSAWEQLSPIPSAEGDALTARFGRACEAYQARHASRVAARGRQDRLLALCGEAEVLVETPDLVEATKAWPAIHRRWRELLASGGAEAGLEDRFARAEARLRERETEQRAAQARREEESLTRLQGLADRVEKLVHSEGLSLKEADRRLREVRVALEDPGPVSSRPAREAIAARLAVARKALHARFQELRQDDEWKRWANMGVQEELCVRVEALREAQDLEAVTQELRDIDLRWKQAAFAPREKADVLWTRFKTARDQVWSRLEAHRAAKAAEHAENLKRKEELCERAEASASSNDWLKTSEELQKLQAEWKAIGPVPRQHSQAVWQRFRTACDRFFSRRKKDRTERTAAWKINLQKKTTLCEQAEGLAESTDWEAAAAEIKRLQSEWKAVGPVRKSQSEAVWQRLRTASDRFFERYKNRDELELAARLAAREALCAEIEALLPAAEGAEAADDLAARVQALQATWRGSPLPSGEQGETLAARFTSARTRLVATWPASFRGTELDPEANRKKLERLCARAEAMLSELAPPAADASSVADLAARLRNALATNTIAGKGEIEARWRVAAEELESAKEAWRRVGPVPPEAAEALVARFESACRRFAEQRPAPAPAKPRPAERRPRPSPRQASR